MKKSAQMSSLVLFTVLLLSFSAVNSWEGVKLYKMTGEITAIDVEYHTVVIEVPMGERPSPWVEHFLLRLFWKEVATR